VLNVVQGYGEEAGQPLVEDRRVAVVSFTGSTAVGRMIARVAGERLAKVCLELGGKNPLVVCDDANLEKAAEAAALSAFSNAGQRCAAGSRMIVFDSVYDRFRELLLERTAAQKVGPDDEHDFGPVINERQLENMLAAVERAKAAGATVVTGGERLPQPGFYIAPTIVEGAAPDSEISCQELFGPISLQGLAQDRFVRLTAGKLPEAEFAFVDEIFKSNSAVLNALLSIINERVFHNDGAPVRCPLVSLFAASNELPEGKELEALFDRFLLRFDVGYLLVAANLRGVLVGPEETFRSLTG